MEPKNVNEQNQQTQSPSTQIPVMDVKPPEQYTPVQNIIENSSDPIQPPASDSVPEQVNTQPTATTESDATPTQQPLEPTLPVQDESQPTNQPSTQQSEQHKSSSKKWVIILISVLVLLSLTGAAIYYFMSSKEDATPTQSFTTASSTSTQPKPDVSQAVNDIKTESSALNDTQDFPQDSLSDASLSL